MVDSLLLPGLAWLLLMGLASGAGLALVGAWPWAAAARASGVALAAGVACAPLLAGLAMVAVLWAWPGAAPRAQAACVFGLLAVVAFAGWVTGATRRAFAAAGDLVPRGPAAVLTWGFFAALLIDSLAVPLIQNDALEYATVGRILLSELTPLVEAQIDGQARAHGISRDQVIRDVLLAQQPNKRFATVEELGALTVFLASDAAASITGIALPVDGGWTAH